MVVNRSVGQTPKCKGRDVAGLTATPKTFYIKRWRLLKYLRSTQTFDTKRHHGFSSSVRQPQPFKCKGGDVAGLTATPKTFYIKR